MASHLSTDQIDRIILLVDTWSGENLTWKALCDLVESRLFIRPSRQTLHRQERIRNAYRTRKNDLRTGAGTVDQGRVPNNRLNRLTAEVARLEREVDLIQERLARWQFNARLHGLTKQQLDAPLPRVDRAQAS